MDRMKALTLLAAACVLHQAVAAGQQREGSPAPAPPPAPAPRIYMATPPPTTAAAVEKLGKNLLRIGNVRVDLSKKEVSVAGTINDVPVLEFVANTKGGFKSYESAIETDTNAIDFNLGL